MFFAMYMYILPTLIMLMVVIVVVVVLVAAALVSACVGQRCIAGQAVGGRAQRGPGGSACWRTPGAYLKNSRKTHDPAHSPLHWESSKLIWVVTCTLRGPCRASALLWGRTGSHQWRACLGPSQLAHARRMSKMCLESGCPQLKETLVGSSLAPLTLERGPSRASLVPPCRFIRVTFAASSRAPFRPLRGDPLGPFGARWLFFPGII